MAKSNLIKLPFIRDIWIDLDEIRGMQEVEPHQFSILICGQWMNFKNAEAEALKELVFDYFEIGDEQ